MNSSTTGPNSMNHRYSYGQASVIACILIALTLLTACTNLLVASAILVVRRLRKPPNMLVLNLAVSDLLISLIVLPMAIAHQLRQFLPFNALMCALYIGCDVFACTASIISICLISIDRFLVIRSPLTYAHKRTFSRMAAMIVSCWLLSGVISLPALIKSKQSPDQAVGCGYPDDLPYQLYATSTAFFIPLLVMVALYSRILFIVRKISMASRHIQCRPIVNGLAIGQQASSLPDFHRSAVSVGDWCVGQESNGRISSEGSAAYSNIRRRTMPWLCLSATARQLSQHTVSTIENMKAVTTLGIIMGCLIACWLPFFTFQLVKPMVKLYQINLEYIVGPDIPDVFLWLVNPTNLNASGYINSLLNPFIYAKFNRDFRQPLAYIVKCQCRDLNHRRMRRRRYLAMIGTRTCRRRQTLTVEQLAFATNQVLTNQLRRPQSLRLMM